MTYNFDDSRKKLYKELLDESHLKSIESEQILKEKPVSLTFYRQFLSSIVCICVFYFLTFFVFDMVNIFARFGLGLYLSYPSLSIIAEILFTHKVRYKYYEGIFTVGNYRFNSDDIKKVAITEYSPYYMKNKYFKIPAFNFVGYKEFLVQITPLKGRGDDVYFFLCSKSAADNFMNFLYKNKIQYGHVEKEFRKLFFYY